MRLPRSPDEDPRTPPADRRRRAPGEDRDTVATGDRPLVVGEVVVTEHALRQHRRGTAHLLKSDDVAVAVGEPPLETPFPGGPNPVDVEARDAHAGEGIEPHRHPLTPSRSSPLAFSSRSARSS